MPTFITKLFDLLFLPTEAEKIVRDFPYPGTHLSQPGTHTDTVELADYTHPVTRASIVANKFQQHPKAARLLGELLGQWYTKQPHGSEFIFIPIPLSAERLKQRKHNQVETILQAMPQEIAIRTNLLSRTRNTTPQTNLPRTERLQNLTGAFTAHNLDMLPSSCTIVLVDDVVTTGATLDEAYRTIKKQLPNRSIKILRLAAAH